MLTNVQPKTTKEYFSVSEVADILSVSKETLRRWDVSGKLKPQRHPMNNYRVYHVSQLQQFEEANLMLNTLWDEEYATTPTRPYNSIELFAGGGGLAVGLEKAGFQELLLNEWDKDACKTLRANRPNWNVVEGDVAKVDFTPYKGKIDFLSGGFPCQAFSYAGKKLGFGDTRGTLFHQFARAIAETQPKVFLGENVRGLLAHDKGKTLQTITKVLGDLGYDIIPPKVLKAVFYMVPQKRERLFIVGIRKDLGMADAWKWPQPFKRIMTMRDGLKKGILYNCDCPASAGQQYPEKKRKVMAMVPPGGYWRDLPEDVQKDYMKASYYMEGGRTGMARRLSWDEPSLTLTCAPAQKQTERCHPEETRPLTVREYARIQTFPDEWKFEGSLSSQYKQIGNAVPVNLAYAMGRALVRLLNEIERSHPSENIGVNELRKLARMSNHELPLEFT